MPTSRQLRRALLPLLGVATLSFGASACADEAAQPQPAYAAQTPGAAHAVALVNSFRSAHGLGPLVEAGDATSKAQQQANAMAAAGSIWHSDLASALQPGWYSVGENVGYGGSVDEIQSSLEASSPHRANMLSTSYNQVGVGVAVAGNGQVYVAQEFVGR